MKKGTAIRGKESQPVTAFCDTMSSGTVPSPVNMRAMTVAMPME